MEDDGDINELEGLDSDDDEDLNDFNALKNKMDEKLAKKARDGGVSGLVS